MKIFILKLVLIIFFIYILFEFTIGKRVDKALNNFNLLGDHHSRIELKNKILDEMNDANKKDKIFNNKEKIIISTFLEKIRKELSTAN